LSCALGTTPVGAAFTDSILQRSPGLLALALAVPSAAQNVSSTGDVSPPFAPAPVVDLTGQRLFIGNTSGGVGGIGTVTVSAGGILTAAQIVPGVGGLGTGFVNVTGAGSTIRLTGGAAFNGLDVGSWGTGVVTVANGGLIACASVAACAFNTIGNAAGSTGTLAINGGSVTGLGQLSVGVGTLQPGFGTPGANTTATLSITNAGALSSNGFSTVGANNGQTGRVTGNVTIDGAGSKWTIGRDLAGGGSQAGLGLAPNTNGVANVTLSNGGNLTIIGSRSNPATDNSLPVLNMSIAPGATSTLTVTTGATIRFGGDSGVVNVGGGMVSAAGSTATLNITGAGSVSGTGANGLMFSNVGQGGASGTINISGAGSQLVLAGVGGLNTQGLDGTGAVMVVGRDRGAAAGGGGNGAVNITAGGGLVVSDNGQAAASGVGVDIARGADASGTVTVSGAGSSITVSSTGGGAASPYVNVGNGGTARMTISDGATVSVLGSGQRNFTVNVAGTGSGTLNVLNGGVINASRFAVADNGGSAIATLDRSTVNLDGVIFFNGDPIGAGVRVGRGVGADGLLTLQNGAAINVSNTIANASVILGGTASLAGGTGTLNMSGGSTITFTGSAASASLQVGGTNGTGFMTMTGNSVVNVGATGGASVGATAGSSGTLNVSGGSSITANAFGIGGNSDTEAGGNGSAVVTGLGSALVASGANGFVGVGRGGTGSLEVTNQAAINAIAFGVGRADSGVGTLTVNNASLNLSGQQTAGNLAGANLSIGALGGFGAATISNGSVVTISNPGSAGASLNVGGTPLSGGGTGVLNVNNSQINVAAAPGQATARIGYDGNAIATFTASTLNVGNATASGADGSLIIAGQPGSTGVLSLNAGSVVNANYIGVGASPAGPGGTASLVLNNSVVHGTTFEIGARGVLSGENGLVNVSGNVIVAGTISPGNSPAILSIDCNLLSLPGSKLILDILKDGAAFNIDHLRIGNNSTFDLTNFQVVFNFLGDTDPNAFAATGGFDLDNFLQAFDVVTGQVSGLSTLFAPGQTWTNVVDAAKFTAESSAYDLSNLQLQADGSLSIVATPVPEPSTWAILVFGLLAVGRMARRSARLNPA
jgi:T5SS/PEP-CTERM-associated repeat protein